MSLIQDINDDPLVSLVRESMKEKSTDFVTPTKASGEAQEEEISPTILEAAKTLSKVASQSVSKAKSTDKGKRYRRRARSMAKNINTRLDAEDEINTARVEINTGIEDVNTGSTKVDTGRTSISTSSIIPSPKKGQREGKAQMVEEDIQATHKTKEKIRQEEAGLEEAIRLQTQMDKEAAKQIHLDKMAAKRVQEEQELAKLEANTEVVKSLQEESISNDDFAKRMVEMINKKKKFYVEQKAKAKRSKPMTQAQQREYMITFIKNQSSWKLSQLKKLSFEELKTEFEKLMKSIESFVPMETEARVKRHGLQLEQETSKKQKIDIEDASITKGKYEVVKEEEAEVPVKKTGKRRKQNARKGINIAKTAQDEFNNEREAFVKDKVKDASSESEIGVDAIPTATKPPTIVIWKIISESSQKDAYHIIRRDGSDKIYMRFGAILKDFSRDNLIELYRLVIKKYGANRLEEMYDRFTMSNRLQELASPRQTALLATPEQTATGKEISNPLIADSLLKTIRLSMRLVIAMNCDEEKTKTKRQRVQTRTGLHRPSVSTASPSISTARHVSATRPSINTTRPVCTARPSINTTRPSINTARPVSTARPSVSTARPIYATRPTYPRMDNSRLATSHMTGNKAIFQTMEGFQWSFCAEYICEGVWIPKKVKSLRIALKKEVPEVAKIPWKAKGRNIELRGRWLLRYKSLQGRRKKRGLQSFAKAIVRGAGDRRERIREEVVEAIPTATQPLLLVKDIGE
ncbi:hypothetical protein Tco_0644882 [Tanacetum coccineum]